MTPRHLRVPARPLDGRQRALSCVLAPLWAALAAAACAHRLEPAPTARESPPPGHLRGTGGSPAAGGGRKAPSDEDRDRPAAPGHTGADSADPPLAGSRAPGPSSGTGTPPPAAPADEPNVRPGVNDRYRRAPVGRFVKMFEGPDREVAARKDAILEMLAVEPGTTIADVGAGTGLFTFDLAARTGPDGRVYAVDVTPSFLAHLRKEKARRGVQNVRIVEATPKSARLPAGAIDLVFLCDVYHHLEYPRTYMASLYRALRPGGRLVVIDFRRDPKRSPHWVLSHVRAGAATVQSEIESVGFVYEKEYSILSQNYVMLFRKPGRQPAQTP